MKKIIFILLVTGTTLIAGCSSTNYPPEPDEREENLEDQKDRYDVPGEYDIDDKGKEGDT